MAHTYSRCKSCTVPAHRKSMMGQIREIILKTAFLQRFVLLISKTSNYLLICALLTIKIYYLRNQILMIFLGRPNSSKIFDLIRCFNVAFCSFKRLQLQEWTVRNTNRASNFDYPIGYASLGKYLHEFYSLYKSSLQLLWH